MMRLLLCFILTTGAPVFLRAQPTLPVQAKDPNPPKMVFDTTTCWFDTVYQGSIIDNEFHFTNKGKTPLIIYTVMGSSGSVCPSYPKEPIAPGKSGMIRVVFHTGGKIGPQDKTVTVTSNASEPTIVLHIRGYVILPLPPPPPAYGPKIAFDTLSFSYDTIEQGAIVEQEFRFRNTGTEPLIISSVVNGDGGMYPDYYPKEPIAPGQTGVIRMRFNSIGKLGPQNKAIYVESNAINGQVVLYWSGTVIASKPVVSDTIPVPLKE